MLERGGELRFLDESLPAVIVRDEVGRQHLQRHHPVQPGILGLIDLAHAAGAEMGDDFVGTQASSGGERHRAPLSYAVLRGTRAGPRTSGCVTPAEVPMKSMSIALLAV